MEKQELATDIRKNRREVIRVQPSSFKGYDLIDVRVWVETEGDDGRKKWTPTPKGITFRQALLGDVQAALNKLSEVLQARSGK